MTLLQGGRCSCLCFSSRFLHLLKVKGKQLSNNFFGQLSLVLQCSKYHFYIAYRQPLSIYKLSFVLKERNGFFFSKQHSKKEYFHRLISFHQVLIYNDNETRFREMQSQSVMLQLVAGDTICLKSYTNQDYALYSNLGNYITFTGYLVFAT